LFVKPARPGLVVRFPNDPQVVLGEDGGIVPPSGYWRRRIGDGDVVIAKRPAPKKEQ
jgi:hypothetical protein